MEHSKFKAALFLTALFILPLSGFAGSACDHSHINIVNNSKQNLEITDSKYFWDTMTSTDDQVGREIDANDSIDITVTSGKGSRGNAAGEIILGRDNYSHSIILRYGFITSDPFGISKCKLSGDAWLNGLLVTNNNLTASYTAEPGDPLIMTLTIEDAS